MLNRPVSLTFSGRASAVPITMFSMCDAMTYRRRIGCNRRVHYDWLNASRRCKRLGSMRGLNPNFGSRFNPAPVRRSRVLLNASEFK